MNDNIIFFAFATLFGLGMLVVGWALRGLEEEREVRSAIASWSRDYPDDADTAGA